MAKPFTLQELEREARSVLGLEAAAADERPVSRGDPAAPAPRGVPRRRAARSEPVGMAREDGGRILIVDDDDAIVQSLQRVLRKAGYPSPIGTTDPREVEEIVREHEPDLVILDLHMPHLDGFEVLARIQPTPEDEDFLPVIVLTGDEDNAVRRRALELGASDFLTKPVELTEALARVRNLLRMRLLHRRILEHNEDLERKVHLRTAELADTRTEILYRLARAAEYRDDMTGRHAGRVGLLAALLATEMGMSMEDRELIRRTAPLHDVGKVAVPDAILRKPDWLTDPEFEVIKTHTTVGAKILEGSQHEILRMARMIAEHHHERWDGSGYPHGLAGEDIPTAARIVAVADTFDVLTHRRPYKPPVSPSEAMEELARCRGAHFDPAVVDAFRATAERVGPEALPTLVDPADPWKDIVA